MLRWNVILLVLTFAKITMPAKIYTMKDAIGFPELEENSNIVNKENRQPVFIPSMCPENELLYPGDQKDDWICDCRPGFLYHPNTDACWQAFRRGPCKDGQYLVLSGNSVIPTCVENPCESDSLVLWQAKCEMMGSMGPCSDNFPPAALWVNATTLHIDCVKLNLESRFGSGIPEIVACPPGCKRSIRNKCVPITGKKP